MTSRILLKEKIRERETVVISSEIIRLPIIEFREEKQQYEEWKKDIVAIFMRYTW